MITKSKTLNNLPELRKEVQNLRSFIIGLAGKDPEGNYRPEFVKKILKSSEEKIIGKFTNSDDFLSLVK